jgi:hypothetical protein
MNPDQAPYVPLATELPDEAAVALVEILYELATLIESQYLGQIHRHYQSEQDNRPAETWNEHDTPF